MSYSTFINIAYWTVLGIIILLVWFIAGLSLALLVLRSRRWKRLRRERELRWLLIEAGRDGRAMEDTCWFLLRENDAKLARQLGGTREFVLDINEHRRPVRTLFSDLQEAL